MYSHSVILTLGWLKILFHIDEVTLKFTQLSFKCIESFMTWARNWLIGKISIRNVICFTDCPVRRSILEILILNFQNQRITSILTNMMLSFLEIDFCKIRFSRIRSVIYTPYKLRQFSYIDPTLWLKTSKCGFRGIFLPPPPPHADTNELFEKMP